MVNVLWKIIWDKIQRPRISEFLTVTRIENCENRARSKLINGAPKIQNNSTEIFQTKFSRAEN